MNSLHRSLRVGVGIAVFFAAYWFLTRNQIVTEFVRPQVDSGKLGVATANAVTSVIEILAAIGGVVIAIVSRLLDYLAQSMEPLIRHISSSANPGNDIAVNQDPERLTEDLARLLIQAVVEGNRELTVQLAHRLSGKSFLNELKEEQ